MAIDYKKELEAAARSMILVHEPDTLIRMIVRMIAHKLKVTHAGILLYEKSRQSYVLTVSRGIAGFKIPKGFARMGLDNPLISFFREHLDKKIFHDGALAYVDVKKAAQKKNLNPKTRKLLKALLYQMEIYSSEVCIPSYFRDDLLGLLLLGEKKNGKKFHQDELNFFVALAHDVAMAIRNAQLFKDLELELEKERSLFKHTTIALAAAIDAKDHYTQGHTSRVNNICMEIAKRLSLKNKNIFNQNLMEHLDTASLLHDIGKIGIPENILNKEGALDENEMKFMQQHPLIGATILSPIKELAPAILGVKYHHEKYDGTGYPEGLKADQIPLVASIISVADTFDAITTNRPYRKGLSREEAIEEIEKASGTQFDPEIAQAFIELYREKYLPTA